jgi:hypothetical protein
LVKKEENVMKRIFWLLALGSIVWATPSLAAPSGKVLCYALANNATAPLNMSYTPDSRSAFNPSGGGISVTHTGTGTYSVLCSGVGVGGIGFETVGNVQVTAVGDDNTYCHLKSWASGAVLAGSTSTIAATSPGTHIFFDQFDASVVCFGGGGTGGGPKDSEFSLLFVY